MSSWRRNISASLYMSDGNAQITRTPAMSLMFFSMLSTVRGQPLRESFSKMLSGVLSRVLTASMGLRSYRRDNSSLRTLNFVSTSIMAQR